jgi:hypothetical protein
MTIVIIGCCCCNSNRNSDNRHIYEKGNIDFVATNDFNDNDDEVDADVNDDDDGSRTFVDDDDELDVVYYNSNFNDISDDDNIEYIY